MDKLLITGGYPLQGEVAISGAKNAALPILAACLLTEESVILKNVPQLRDVNTMVTLLGDMGLSLIMSNQVCVKASIGSPINPYAPYALVRQMRASILVLGSLLARYRVAYVSLPGGCAIGARPVNFHLDSLQAMGATVSIENGYIKARTKNRLQGATLSFPSITVTGTENVMMAATLAKGKTIINNAAKEPEITDLANFLNKLGARVQGAGTSTITIDGVEALGSCEHNVLPDRIEAATFLIAAACTQGFIRVKIVQPQLLISVIQKLTEVGATIEIGENWIQLDMRKRRARAVNIQTAPYPGFPTDVQAQMTALCTTAEGVSSIAETIFENRFMHVQELRRMGANIHINSNLAICHGVEKLSGAPVMASDLRGSASLVLAGLMAKGETLIDRIYHIDRGYENIETKLASLGAKIQRLSIREPN